LITAVAWLPDASGLFFVGAKKSEGLRSQIWFQPYPSGEPFKITNDLNQYVSLSITGDGKSFVTSQSHSSATIYVGDAPSILNDKIDWKLAPISTQQATGYALSWTSSGKLLQMDSGFAVYVTAADGSNRARLLDNTPLAFNPNSCGPGDIVTVSTVSEGNTANLWRLNLATGEMKQLESGKDAENSSCTPDGKWVFYRGLVATDAIAHIFKVSIDGGTPVELASGSLNSPAVSPDGKLIAYVKSEGQGANTKNKFVVQKIEGGAPVQEIGVLSFPLSLGWTPDGRALSYVDNTKGNLQNVYMQPLTGGAPVQLTHFDSEPAVVSAYAWSKDGKKLAITRARYADTDVVMFSGYR